MFDDIDLLSPRDIAAIDELATILKNRKSTPTEDTFEITQDQENALKRAASIAISSNIPQELIGPLRTAASIAKQLPENISILSAEGKANLTSFENNLQQLQGNQSNPFATATAHEKSETEMQTQTGLLPEDPEYLAQSLSATAQQQEPKKPMSTAAKGAIAGLVIGAAAAAIVATGGLAAIPLGIGGLLIGIGAPATGIGAALIARLEAFGISFAVFAPLGAAFGAVIGAITKFFTTPLPMEVEMQNLGKSTDQIETEDDTFKKPPVVPSEEVTTGPKQTPAPTPTQTPTQEPRQEPTPAADATAAAAAAAKSPEDPAP